MPQRNRNKEAGQALIFGVVTLGILLIGMAGMGIDMGYLRFQKRLQQTAADNAALAGASDLVYGDPDPVAKNAAMTDGFSAASVNVNQFPPPAPASAVGSISLTVNNPPLSGPHANDSSTTCSPSPSCYVEVYLAQVQPSFFMRVLGVNSQTITARAVAYWGNGNGKSCVYVLGNPGAGVEGFTGSGTPQLNANDPNFPCGIADNGDFTTNGAKLDVSAASIGVAGSVGKVQGTVCCASDCNASTCPVSGIAPSEDPLGYLTAPTVGTPVSFNSASITPGSTYSSISVTGGTNGTCPNGGGIGVSAPGIVFPSGTYIVDGSLTFNGSSTVCGTGVTFYITNGGSVTINGTTSVQFTAPTSGTYSGILFYQDPNDTSAAKINGTSNSYFQGALYFPKAALDFSGTGGTLNSGAAYTLIVSDSLTVKGTATVDLKSDVSSLLGGSPFKTVTLVE